MQKKTVSLILLSLLGVPFLQAQTLHYTPNTVNKISLSSTNPNYISIKDDKITAITSKDNTLQDEQKTADGGAMVSVIADKPFSLFVQTESGQVIQLNATPKKEEGQSIQLVSDNAVKPINNLNQDTKKTAYQTRLVSLIKSVVNGKTPKGFIRFDPKNETIVKHFGKYLTIKPIEGMSSDKYKVVQFQIMNTGKTTLPIEESDFYQNGVLAVMFTDNIFSLIPQQITNLIIVERN